LVEHNDLDGSGQGMDLLVGEAGEEWDFLDGLDVFGVFFHFHLLDGPLVVRGFHHKKFAGDLPAIDGSRSRTF